MRWGGTGLLGEGEREAAIAPQQGHSAQCRVLTPPAQSSPRKLTSGSSPILGQQEGDYLTGPLELSSSKIWLGRELWGSWAQIPCLPAVGIK